MDWISVKDDMPKEHDTIFKKFYGTNEWKAGMFKTTSDEVLVSVKFSDGRKITDTAHTLDGRWSRVSFSKYEITHWMPFPKPAEVE